MYLLAARIVSVAGGSGCDVVIPAPLVPLGPVMQGIHSGGVPITNCHAGTCTQWTISEEVSEDISEDISEDVSDDICKNRCTELQHRNAHYAPRVPSLHVSTSTKGNSAKAVWNTKPANDPVKSQHGMASEASLSNAQAETHTHTHTYIYTHTVRLALPYRQAKLTSVDTSVSASIGEPVIAPSRACPS